ncbi:MAG TPA: hypothetical protein DEO36_01315 [Flavobacteriaceae bacterium]|jgi:hypothetical protein|nr:hypothetical protein [Flavobacteriaceae bacterium]
MKINFKNNRMMKELPSNHREIFEQRLKKELYQKRKRNYWVLKVAATTALLLSLGYYYNSTSSIVEPYKTEESITLGSLSPELEQIESYYTNAIVYELSQLEISKENKPILDKYFDRLGELTSQYKNESAQLDIDKISEKSINALIDNLQLRLQLLLQLKEKLNNSKDKKNEQNTV